MRTAPTPPTPTLWRKTRKLRKLALSWAGALLLGVIVGAVAWRAEVALSDVGREKIVAGMNPREFVQLVSMMRRPGAAPLVENLVVHPVVDGKHLVTGNRTAAASLMSSRGGASEFEFVAPMPFVVSERTGRAIAVTQPSPPAAQTGSVLSRLFGGGNSPPPVRMVPEVVTKTYPSILAYLDNPPVPYEYARWEEPKARAQMWIGGGVGVFGLLLPLGVFTLRRAGVMATPPEEEEPEDRPVYAEEKKTAPSVDTAAVAAQLHEVTAGLEENLSANMGVGGTAHTDKTAGPQPISQLTGGPVEAVPLQPEEEKNFDAGTFYPVSRGKKTH